MKFTHQVHPSLLSKVIKITVVGAGGTGSNLIPRLAQIDLALKELGHPYGLDVLVIDDDRVSHANVGRQLFYASDVGQYKASIIINRLNQHFGLRWGVQTERLTKDNCIRADVVIGCVDTRKARAAIHKACSRDSMYWLDCGNNTNSGQVLIGQFKTIKDQAAHTRLPNVADLFPELVDERLDGKDDGPSCSLAEALRKQNLMINPMMAMEASNLLWTLFRTGELKYSGKFINLDSGISSPIRIDTDVWARMGYQAPPLPVPKEGKKAGKKLSNQPKNATKK